MFGERVQDGVGAMLESIRCLFERAMNLLGPAFVALAVTLISFVIYTHFSAILPFYHQQQVFAASWPAVLHLLISSWLSFNIVFNYAASVAVSPGIAPADIDEADADAYLVNAEVSSETGALSEQKQIIRHCKSCSSSSCATNKFVRPFPLRLRFSLQVESQSASAPIIVTFVANAS